MTYHKTLLPRRILLFYCCVIIFGGFVFAQAKMHTVVQGETLYSIAQKYHISVQTLKRLNNLASNNLVPGVTLKVSASSSGTSREDIHVVQSGETLFSIARKYGVSTNQIMAQNNLQNTTISVGQKLIIPSSASRSSSTPSQLSGTTHTIHTGETLFSIARKYGTQVDRLMALNNLSNTSINLGQTLKVPGGTNGTQPRSSTTTARNTHTVKAGETLYSIARNYNMSIDALQRLNSLSSSSVTVGQILAVRGNSRLNNQGLYVVQPRETVYSIASKFGISVEKLRSLNSLASDELKAGQYLIINENGGNTVSVNSHTVKPGETLYSIASRYAIKVDDLMATNGSDFHGRSLQAGETIKLPKGSRGTANNTRTYTVKAGDTFTSIARLHSISVANLKDFNNTHDSDLRVGQTLKIPSTRGVSLRGTLGPIFEKGQVIKYSLASGATLSSGKRYNPNELTVSHRNIPYNTVVLLTNTATGNSTFAEVNDRGPLKEGYMMDVSEKVAQALGISPRDGATINVRIVKQ